MRVRRIKEVPIGKPVVVHAIRGYLAPTETFVGYQVRTLRDYRPIVVAHHRSPNRDFDIDEMFVVNENTKGVQGMLGTFSYQMLRSLPPSAVRLAENWIRQFNPALLHFHFAVDAAFFVPLYRRAGIPAVVSLYGYDISSFPKSFGGFGGVYLKRAFHAMDCFLTMSQDMKRDAIAAGIPAEKIVVHYYGIDSARFRFDERTYCRKNRFNVLCVGSLDKKKGQHHLLRSLSALRKARPDIDARVTLVGNGNLRRELELFVEEHRLADRVVFAGHVSHFDPKLLQFYRDADVFVHFSTTQPNNDKEGIPGTIVEAMASGLPVVTAHHAGIPEAITNHVHGLLLEEKDVDGIARSLIDLYESEEMRGRLGRAAAQRALNDLNVHTKTRELENIYNDVVSR